MACISTEAISSYETSVNIFAITAVRTWNLSTQTVFVKRRLIIKFGSTANRRLHANPGDGKLHLVH